MDNTIKLYDITVGDFPLSDLFRTLQVHECRICKALTNLACWGNHFMGGARYYCKNAKEPWHHTLESKQHLLFEPHPKAYIKAMKEEIEEIHKSVEAEDDLLGEVDRSQKADAILHDGFVMYGIGFRPGGKKRLTNRFSEGAFPPFVEEVFQTVMREHPPEISLHARASLQASHELQQTLKEVPRGEMSIRLENAGRELRRLGLLISSPEMRKKIEDLKSQYRQAYGQWLAENHFATIRSSPSSQ